MHMEVTSPASFGISATILKRLSGFGFTAAKAAAGMSARLARKDLRGFMSHHQKLSACAVQLFRSQLEFSLATQKHLSTVKKSDRWKIVILKQEIEALKRVAGWHRLPTISRQILAKQNQIKAIKGEKQEWP